MNLNQLLARLAQLREWAMRISNGESPEGAGSTEEIRAEMIRLEAEVQVAYAALANPPTEPDPAPDPEPAEPEERDYGELVAAASMARYLEAATTGRPLEGAEAELSAATGCDRSPLPGVVVPWEMFEPTGDELASEAQDFADTASTMQAIDAPFRERWIPRVFARQDVPYLGVRMPAVGVGDHAFYSLTGGTAAAKPAVGVAVESAAATVTFLASKPRRYAARYTYYVEDLVRFRQYESSLRMDLRRLMADGFDSEILARITGGLAAGNYVAATAAVLTEAEFRNIILRCVDAKQRAYTFDAVRVLMGLKSYKILANIAEGNAVGLRAPSLSGQSAGHQALPGDSDRGHQAGMGAAGGQPHADPFV